MRRAINFLTAGAFIALIAYLVAPIFTKPVMVPGGPNSVRAQSGPYYRITANYIYKGEPVSLQFLLACAGLVTTYRDNDRSHDVYGGPQMYGNVMRDGKALVLSTRAFCTSFREEEPNASMPANFMPVTIVYDNADTLEHGVAYMSDDAYENSSSVLKFIDMGIQTIRRNEAETLLKSQKPNAVRTIRNTGFFTPPQPGKRPNIGTHCVGWALYPLPDSMKEDFVGLWPSDQPKYWQPEENAEYKKLATRTVSEARIHGKDFWSTLMPQSGWAGLARRNGGGSARNKDPRFPFTQPMAEWYPHRRLSHNEWDDSSRYAHNAYAQDVARKGFFYCVGRRRTDSQIVLPPRLTINGQEVRNYSANRPDLQVVWVENRFALILWYVAVADGFGEQEDERK